MKVFIVSAVYVDSCCAECSPNPTVDIHGVFTTMKLAENEVARLRRKFITADITEQELIGPLPINEVQS